MALRPGRVGLPTTFWTRAAGLLAVAVVVRGVGMAVGWFYADDFVLFARAEYDSFGEVLSTFYTEGGHVAWVNFAVGWVLGRYAPFGWTVHVLVATAGYLVTGLLVLLLFTRLWCRRNAVLGLFAGWLFLGVVTASTTWFSQYLLFVFLTISSTLVALAVHRALSGSAWWVAVATLAYLIAMSLSERSLVLAPTLALLVVAVHGMSSPLPWRRVLLLGAGMVIGACCFLTLYLVRSDMLTMAGSRPVSAGERGWYFIYGVGVALTSLVGGPWTIRTDTVAAAATVTPAQALTALAVLSALAAVSVLRIGRRALLLWSLLAGYLLVDVLVITVGRTGGLGLLAMQTVRYYSDLALVLALVLGGCFLSTVGPSPDRWRRFRAELSAQRLVVLLCSVALVIGTLSSSAAQYLAWHRNPARPFLTGAIHDTAAVPGLVLIDTQLPGQVITPLLTRYTLASRVLVGYPGAPRFGAPSTQPGILDDDGRVRPAQVEGGVGDVPNEKGCPHPVAAGGAEIPLQGALYDWNWLVRLDYTSSISGEITLDLGSGAPVLLPVVRGSGSVYIEYSGTVNSARIEPPPVGMSLCVRALRIGNAVPDPDQGLDAWENQE